MSITEARLAEARARIDLLCAMRAKGAELSAELEQLQTGAPANVLTVRCDQPHKGGMPKMAQAVIFGRHLLFKTKIDWMPSDILTLRPWARDTLEGYGLDSATYELAMSDDDFLARMLERNDEWAAGIEPHGERWLARTGPFESVMALPLEEVLNPLAPSLWVRCKDHPEDMTAYRPAEIVKALR